MRHVNAIILLPASLLCGLMVVHSLQTRGRSVTLAYGLMGTALFIARQILIRVTDVYTFNPTSLRVMGLAVVDVVGWFFATYISLVAAETLLRRYRPQSYGKTFLTAVLASFVTVPLSFAVEAAGQSSRWWHFNSEVTRNDLYGFSIEGVFMVPHGWAITTVMMALATLLNLSPRWPQPAYSPARPLRSIQAIWLLFCAHCGIYLLIPIASLALMALFGHFSIIGFYVVLLILCLRGPTARLRYWTPEQVAARNRATPSLP